jgi:hypothetical protein
MEASTPANFIHLNNGTKPSPWYHRNRSRMLVEIPSTG